MCVRERHVADIARREVKCPRRYGRGEDRDSRISGNEEVPLVAVGVPMYLPHSTGLHYHKSDTEVECNGESGRVDDLDGTAWNDVRFLLGEVISIGVCDD